MNSAHKWLIAALSLFLIFYSSFVVWYYFEKSSIPTSQPELAQNVSDKMGKVLSGAGCEIPTIVISGSDFTPTTITAEYASMVYPSTGEVKYFYAVCIYNADVYPTPHEIKAVNWPAGTYYLTGQIEGQHYGEIGLLQPGTYKFYLDNNSSTTGTIIAEQLTTQTNTGTNQTSTKKTTTTTNKNETIKNIALPSVFTAAGSTTTNLAAIADPKNVTNLTLDVVGKSKVVFSDSIDLSTTTAKDLFKQLNSYVRMTTLGVVSFDSSVLSMLANKKASISMFNLPFVDKPDILVNGKLATNKIVSNVAYKNKTLTFNVTGFSTYEAVPKLTIIEPGNGFVSEKKEITLRGKITDPTATVSAKLNGVSLGKLKVATESGEFTTNLKLIKGTNNIRVEALSKFGPPLVATASAVFKPLVSSEMFIIGGIGLVLILIIVIVWWYYKKRKSKIISTI